MVTVSVEVCVLFVATCCTTGLGLICLDCQNTQQPQHCHTVSRCEADETCHLTNQSTPLPTTGALCRQCCSHVDLCNAASCGGPGYPVPRGPICYACQNQSSLHMCKDIDVCAENEVCSLHGQDVSGDFVFRSECKPQQSCMLSGVGSPVIIGRRRQLSVRPGNQVLCDKCCEKDLCNLNCSYDHCFSSPCQHGTCSSDGSTFTCHCLTGWSGSVCNEPVRDCKDVLQKGVGRSSGVYEVQVNVSGHLKPLLVYCDMDTARGGWTVFQKRYDGLVDFYRNWTDYENGFGNLKKEFWLGLKWIYYMTRYQEQELRVDLVQKGQPEHAKYSNFSIGPPENYTLHVSDYGGTAGDRLAIHDGMAFTTKDRDQDDWDENCAEDRHGAYWYIYCGWSNLNGKYNLSRGEWPTKGFYWNNFDHLSASQMKFRRI